MSKTKDYSNRPVSEVLRDIRKSFLKKNVLQKIVWIVFVIIMIYAFFATPTRNDLFLVTIIATPIAFLLDWILSTNK